jgi:NDP-sugar pyrophosphorylase family protein
MKAMILAAGLGTRLRPLTNTLPKALVPVNGTPLLEHVIQRLKLYGFHEIIINVHHFAEQVLEFLQHKRNFGMSIAISDERDKLLDTGGGLKKAAWFFDDGQPFLVHNVDILTDLNLSDFYDAHCQSQALATLAVTQRQGSRYLLFNQENLLCGWESRITGERKIVRSIPEENLIPLGFSCLHVMQPEIFDLLPEQEVFSVTDTYLELAVDHTISAFRHDESFWMDVGRKESLIQAEKFLRHTNSCPA